MCTRQDMEDKKIIETGEPVVFAGCFFFYRWVIVEFLIGISVGKIQGSKC